MSVVDETLTDPLTEEESVTDKLPDIFGIIMSWSRNKQRDYLKDKSEPASGVKSDLTQHIATIMDFEEAATLITEYGNGSQT